ncbi:hypothetical protein TorRG33x02_201270 [Trema orientale]|uniref:Uncharacterized protein n=1 Tax=Trema orientale TaxID=63057 RepID=A0A2P5EEZ4_TREOI|nr:hypothetical protein TorRG33x02_201270 [Trema orientale]
MVGTVLKSFEFDRVERTWTISVPDLERFGARQPPWPLPLQLILPPSEFYKLKLKPSNNNTTHKPSVEAAIRKQNKGAPIKFLVPLVYAPVLPLIRIALRKNPVVRDRLFTAVLAGAFAHGFYLVTDLYDIESK